MHAKIHGNKMKRSDVLAIIATIVLLVIAFFTDGYVLFGLIIWIPIIIWRIMKKKDKKAMEEEVVKPITIEEAIAEYGEPDDSIIADATRANEAAGSILVYKQKRILVFGGVPVSMDTIKDVSSVNTATPYTFGQYQVVLTTTLHDRQYMRLDVGMDAEWARDVAMQVIDAMK